jgi:hypothetical protein
MKDRKSRIESLREECYDSLWKFAHTVVPYRVYGECHRDIFDFWQKAEVENINNTLVLIPRDHGKSFCLAIRCCWEIYRNPAITIIYVSATMGLAERQLLEIKNVLTSNPFRMLSPDMINKEEKRRKMWNTQAIIVDHPTRIREGVRDPTVSIAGLESNITGWHCGFLAKDDVVVKDNAYTLTARKKVEDSCSQLASVLSTGGVECCVGTRYHPDDHYNTLINMYEDIRDEETGDYIDERKVYAVHERQVEDNGVFLWPRQRRAYDGAMFGFNWAELERKKAKYTDRLQYYAQYYNNPNDLEKRRLMRINFNYYKKEHIVRKGGNWYYRERKLNVYASMDFAFSKRIKADYSCIVVFGIDWEFNIYVLQIDRFRTDNTAGYFKYLRNSIVRWEYTQLRAEVTAAQVVIVNSLKDLILSEGLHVRIEQHRPLGRDGAKEERIDAALLPRYEEGKIYHYKGGECTLLEEEIILDNPEHDDISDALASGISANFICRPRRPRDSDFEDQYTVLKSHRRFGGAY